MPQNRLEYNLVAWLIGAKVRLGFDYIHSEMTGRSFCLTKRIKELATSHVVENNLRLLPEALGIPLSSRTHALDLVLDVKHHQFAQTFIDQRNLSGFRLVGFHPGSGTTKNLALRRWAPDKWAELARLLVERDPEIRIVMFGAPAEQVVRNEIYEKSGVTPGSLMSASSGGILESAALIARMDCFVCCDTLLTHVAAAVRVPTVEILGPTDPRSIYPYGVSHRIVRTGIACSPCYVYSRHGIRCTNPEPMQCLNEITPEMVYSSIIDVMTSKFPFSSGEGA
jgi:ADP-heptose:LPS heptosyltransferase